MKVNYRTFIKEGKEKSVMLTFSESACELGFSGEWDVLNFPNATTFATMGLDDNHTLTIETEDLEIYDKDNSIVYVGEQILEIDDLVDAIDNDDINCDPDCSFEIEDNDGLLFVIRDSKGDIIRTAICNDEFYTYDEIADSMIKFAYGVK